MIASFANFPGALLDDNHRQSVELGVQHGLDFEIALLVLKIPYSDVGCADDLLEMVAWFALESQVNQMVR